ncbi:MAG: efflux RND transporter periplasmic adaptor subunit, partial [Pseudomonadota bacterium]
FVVMQKTDVLRVPNAALRYQPKDIESSEGSKTTRSANQSILYQLSEGKLNPVSVTTGISDGNFTEIIEGAVQAGDKAIISEITDKKESESKFRLRIF